MYHGSIFKNSIVFISVVIVLLKFPLFFFLSFIFLGPLPQHMEVLRLGVKLELQLPAYATATAIRDPSQVCKLHHNSGNTRCLTH